MSRGRFSEGVDSLIREEDRGELKKLYGEGCLDEPTYGMAPPADPREKTKNRTIMWQQFMYRASTRRRSLTVDDWLGFCEIPAADSIYSNGFVRLWPADDPAPPESCQQLIAHLAHECADAIRAAAVDPRDTVHQHVDELAAFARKYEREHRLDMDCLGLDLLSKRASEVAEAAEWERECYLKAICNWTPFAELAESEDALRCVAEHPGISVRYFGRFREEVLKPGGVQLHDNQVRDTV